jgi:hypothetical protein
MNDIVPPVVTPASSGLIDRVKSILTKPAATWDVIEAEPSSVQSIYMGYVVPLAAIGPICAAIGSVVIGSSFLGITSHASLIAAIVIAVVTYVMSLIMLYVVAFIIDALAPSFDGQKNMLAAFKLAAYASTSGWVAAILAIFPPVALLAALVGGLYGIYLMYVGLPKLMKSPPQKTIVYMIVIAVVAWVASWVVGLVTLSVGGLGLLGAGAINPMAHLGAAAVPGSEGKLSGTVAIPGVGSMDVGKMQQATAQMEAQASAMQNGQTVKTADPQALLALMPENFMGAARSDPETNSGAAGGMAASGAEATYAVNGGTIHLKVSDIGSVGGLAGMAAAMNVNHTQTTATGYEKVSTDGGKMVSEKYDNQDKSGDYTVVYGSRISVEAEGSNVDMGTLKTLVGQIDAGRAQALVK